MDKLLDIQLQLSRIAADVADPSHLKSASLSPVAVMTPVLIVIEQLLDEIRVSTRAIVAKALEHRQLEPRPTKRLRTDDFRVELQSEDVVDDESETETQDEATGYQVAEAEEMKQEENEDDANEVDTVTGEAHCKPRESTLDPNAAAELEKQIKKCVKSYTNITRKAAELNDKADANQVGRAMSTIARWSSVSMTKLLKLIEGGGVPSVEVANDFCDATVMLPAITDRHRSERSMNHKWYSTVIQMIEQITAIAKINTQLPRCLSDLKLDTTLQQLKEQWATIEPDLLHKMEGYISRVKSQPGALESDRIGKTVGKLASLFRHDCRLSSRGRKPSTIPRTEECWTRFAQIGEVLAEWILLCEQATSKSKLPAQLPCFERKLRGFAKSNPGRVPASLLQ
ncbi:hypothetical protein PF008_g26817 [Phytophthora fragariae]|uniref:Uncharacterized protein n=1 Tax=Phytophthora fragariae TaxID=53985 RepID=A0A6G0QG00_9STRA|nr:hypothetical protein PF008_g26817 [Phytophthora fragariae]